MGKIIKIGDQYYVEFVGNGLLFQKLAGTDKSAAEKMLKDIEESLKKEETDIFKPKEMDYEDFCGKFIQYSSKEYPPKTHERLASALQHFNRFLKRDYPNLVKLKDITPSVIEHYKVRLSKEFPLKKENLINFTLFLLRVVFEYTIKVRGLNDNPTLHLKMKMQQGRFDRLKYNRDFAEQILKENLKYQSIGQQILDKGLVQNSEKLKIDINIKHHGKDVRINHIFLRHVFALNLLDQGLSLFDVFKILKLNDIARVMVYAPYEKPRI